MPWLQYGVDFLPNPCAQFILWEPKLLDASSSKFSANGCPSNRISRCGPSGVKTEVIFFKIWLKGWLEGKKNYTWVEMFWGRLTTQTSQSVTIEADVVY